MKKTLSLAVSALALAAFAEEPTEPAEPIETTESAESATPLNVSSVLSANVFGVLKVSGSCRRYILPTPWCDFQPGVDAPIVASNLLKTANLEVGDFLHLFDDEGNIYNSWQLEDTDGLKSWKEIKQVTMMGESTDSPSVSGKTSPQGFGFMLIRATMNESATGDASDFFLYGQVGTNGVVKGTTIPAGGSEESPVIRLVSCPKAEGWNPNNSDDVEFQADDDYTGDMLRIAQPTGVVTDYYWCNNADDCALQAKKAGFSKSVTFTAPGWYISKKERKNTKVGGRNVSVVVESFAVASDLIPHSFGGWYVSASGVSRTITWKNVQKQ